VSTTTDDRIKHGPHRLDVSAADFEYLSWFGYRPDGTCPSCGEEWTDVMFAYDGPHCPVRRTSTCNEGG
jgi:hypothetical protein